MKIIEYIYKFGFWQFLFRGLLIISAFSMALAVIGLIIAIPTDHGRHFFFVSLSFLGAIFLALLSMFPIMKIIVGLKDTEILFDKLSYRIKFKHHENWNKKSEKTNLVDEVRHDKSTINFKFLKVYFLKHKRNLILAFAIITSIFLISFIVNQFQKENIKTELINNNISENTNLADTNKIYKKKEITDKNIDFDDIINRINNLNDNLNYFEIIKIVKEVNLSELTDKQKKNIDNIKDNAIQNVDLIKQQSEISVFRLYRIKSGENATKIAQKFNMTINELDNQNQSDLYNLKAGNFLKVKQTINIFKITVKQKQTLFQISKKYNIRVAEIKGLNNLKSDNIKAGDKLYVFNGNK